MAYTPHTTNYGIHTTHAHIHECEARIRACYDREERSSALNTIELFQQFTFAGLIVCICFSRRQIFFVRSPFGSIPLLQFFFSRLFHLLLITKLIFLDFVCVCFFSFSGGLNQFVRVRVLRAS